MWVLAVNHANFSMTLSSLSTSAEGKFLLFDYRLYSSFNQQMFIFCGIDLGHWSLTFLYQGMVLLGESNA